MILLTGIVGSGKSLQGRMLADEKGYAWISIGEILRVLITGSRRKEMLTGKLLDDDEVIQVMSKVFELIDPRDEFVLDGFPRSVKQLKWLLSDEIRGKLSRILVFNLFADEELIYERLMKRGRQDDTEQAIKIRFDEYNKVTKPIIEELIKSNIKVHNIDASRVPEEIHNEIMKLAQEEHADTKQN